MYTHYTMCSVLLCNIIILQIKENIVHFVFHENYLCYEIAKIKFLYH